ncbi:MAG: hypothetical protein WAV46_04125 [Candidatus Moraniibacteriota bacterium]
MARIKLDNVNFVMEEDFVKPFSAFGYTFYPKNIKKFPKNEIRITTSKQIIKSNRKHKQNAYVEYSGHQIDSILYRGGRVGENKFKSIKRKFLEDILVIGSLLSAQNWQLFSRRSLSHYPLVSRNMLECISDNADQCGKQIGIAAEKLTNPLWQKQFDDGFHLRMLINHSNIFITESRFLNMVVIWEWLYPHLKNPSGATPSDESSNLKEIFSFILKKYWPKDFNEQLFEKSNIFHVLRNQLAHSGKTPIDRSYAEEWMTKIQWEKGLEQYLRFFDNLTQVLVLKTLGIDAESSLKTFNFPERLEMFLKTGKIK